MEPGFLLSYWRPWDENSSLVNSWGDYIRDKSMAEYSADRIGEHIQRASREQVEAIGEASKMQAYATTQAAKIQSMVMAKIGAAQVEAIQEAAKMIGYQLEDTKKELDFLNRRMDIVIEQQRVGLMLLDDIAQLLKIPDSEKERQQAITLGVQFFVNASKNPELFDDALEEFLKAEKMKKQDYFVLHRIGCIYMFSQKHLDIPKALDYFLRAGKYSCVESDPSALRLANLLTNDINSEYTKQTSNPNSIKLLAGDSYEKAALASYILGDDTKAIDYQKIAISFDASPENRFKLGKYLVRNEKVTDAIIQLNSAVNKKPEILEAIVADLDTACNSAITDFVVRKNSEANTALDDVLDMVLRAKDLGNEELIADLLMGKRLSFARRVRLVKRVCKTF